MRLALRDPLRIEALEKLSELNGATFSSLPDSLKLQFSLRPIKVITLSDKSDLGVRFDLFERLNTGGVALTNQEIRACIYRGPLNEFFDRLRSMPIRIAAVTASLNLGPNMPMLFGSPVLSVKPTKYSA